MDKYFWILSGLFITLTHIGCMDRSSLEAPGNDSDRNTATETNFEDTDTTTMTSTDSANHGTDTPAAAETESETDTSPDASGRVLGEACTSADDCASQHCAATLNGDLVCCNQACDGLCVACSADGYCDQTPETDSRCDVISCTASSACTTYPSIQSIKECRGFGQCETESNFCTPTYSSSDVTCGEVMTCDGNGGCECAADAPCHSECPCDIGEGICTDNDECAEGLVCTTDAIAKLGTSGASCMPAHCTNDVLDTTDNEISQDCGGECGCRATYTEMAMQGIPSTVYIDDMSGDGSMLVGYWFSGNIQYALAISTTTGEVTTLKSFDADGDAKATYINNDGSVIVGEISCASPQTGECEKGDPRFATLWAGVDSAPERLPFTGQVRGMSATGNVLLALYQEDASGPITTIQYRRSTSSMLTTDVFGTTTGNWEISRDGNTISGTRADVTTRTVDGMWTPANNTVTTPDYPSTTTYARILAINNDGTVFAGIDYTMDTTYISRNGVIEILLPDNSDLTEISPRYISSDGTRFVAGANNAGVYEAILWDEAGGLRTLYDELVARGIEFPTDVSELSSEVYLSDDGMIIVGRAFGAPLFWRIELLE